jgi:hypothetical protein
MQTTKRVTATVFVVVAAGIALAVGLWAISLVFASVNQASWSSSANSTFTTVQTNTYNALLLLSVGLIVMGAATIISYFYVGGRGKGGY